MKDKIFFTKALQLKVSEINSVRLIECEFGGPEVIMNNNYHFHNADGIEAIDSLFNCNFYDTMQHKQVTETYKKFLSFYNTRLDNSIDTSKN